MYVNLIAKSGAENKVNNILCDYHYVIGKFRLTEPILYEPERYFFAVSKFNINTHLLPYCLLEVDQVVGVGGEIPGTTLKATTTMVYLSSKLYCKYFEGVEAKTFEDSLVVTSDLLKNTTNVTDELLTRVKLYGGKYLPLYSAYEFNKIVCNALKPIHGASMVLTPFDDGRLGFRVGGAFEAHATDAGGSWPLASTLLPFTGEVLPEIEIRGDATRLFNVEFTNGTVYDSVAMKGNVENFITKNDASAYRFNPNSSYIEYGEKAKRTLYTECKAFLICTEGLPCDGELFPEVDNLDPFLNRIKHKVVSTLIPMPTSNEDMHTGVYYSNENIKDGDRVPMYSTGVIDGFSFQIYWVDSRGYVHPLYAPTKSISLVRFYFGLKTK